MENMDRLRFKPKTSHIYRRLALLCLFIVAGVIQNTGLLPEPFGIPFLPLLPLTAAAGMFERETFGLNFGLLAGIMADVGSGTPDGINAVFYALTGFVCGLLVTYVFLNNIRSFMILGAVFTLLYTLTAWLAHGGAVPGGSLTLLRFYLPTALLNLPTLPLYYYLVRAVFVRFNKDGADDHLLV